MITYSTFMTLPIHDVNYTLLSHSMRCDHDSMYLGDAVIPIRAVGGDMSNDRLVA